MNVLTEEQLLSAINLLKKDLDKNIYNDLLQYASLSLEAQKQLASPIKKLLATAKAKQELANITLERGKQAKRVKSIVGYALVKQNALTKPQLLQTLNEAYQNKHITESDLNIVKNNIDMLFK